MHAALRQLLLCFVKASSVVQSAASLRMLRLATERVVHTQSIANTRVESNNSERAAEPGFRCSAEEDTYTSLSHTLTLPFHHFFPPLPRRSTTSCYFGLSAYQVIFPPLSTVFETPRRNLPPSRQSQPYLKVESYLHACCSSLSSGLSSRSSLSSSSASSSSSKPSLKITLYRKAKMMLPTSALSLAQLVLSTLSTQSSSDASSSSTLLTSAAAPPRLRIASHPHG